MTELFLDRQDAFSLEIGGFLKRTGLVIVAGLFALGLVLTLAAWNDTSLGRHLERAPQPPEVLIAEAAPSPSLLT